MLDEWKGEDGIQVIDGWEFQVNFLFDIILQVLMKNLPFLVFL